MEATGNGALAALIPLTASAVRRLVQVLTGARLARRLQFPARRTSATITPQDTTAEEEVEADGAYHSTLTESV